MEEMKTYVIVSDKYLTNLEDKVLEKIREGYMPIGGVAVGEYLKMQAMVWAKGLKNG